MFYYSYLRTLSLDQVLSRGHVGYSALSYDSSRCRWYCSITCVRSGPGAAKHHTEDHGRTDIQALAPARRADQIIGEEVGPPARVPRLR
jgi:hypothetical protein